MKKLFSIFLFITFLLSALTFLSGCSKKDSGVPGSNCKIITSTIQSGGSTITRNLTYSSDGRVNRITMNDFYKTNLTFNYSGNQLIRDQFYGHWDDQLTGHNLVEYNANGWPVKMTSEYYDYAPSGATPKISSRAVVTHEFNNNGELLKSTTKREYPANPASNSESTELYTWTNGNLTRAENNGTVTDFEYYTDKQVQIGDLFTFNYLQEYGTKLIQNRNLVKSQKITQNGTVQGIFNISYEFDQEGRIVTLTATGSGSLTSQVLKYQYSCN